jgi:hypothetical protein
MSLLGLSLAVLCSLSEAPFRVVLEALDKACVHALDGGCVDGTQRVHESR